MDPNNIIILVGGIAGVIVGSIIYYTLGRSDSSPEIPKSELDELKREVSELDNKMSDLSANNTETQGELRTLENEWQNIKTKVVNTSIDLLSQDDIDKLEQALQDFESKIHKIDKEVIELSRKVDSNLMDKIKVLEEALSKKKIEEAINEALPKLLGQTPSVDSEIKQIKDRQLTQLQEIKRNARLNLTLGGLLSVFTLFVALSFAIMTSKTSTFTENFRRISFTAIAGGASFFFLRLYAKNRQEITECENERMNIQARVLAIYTLRENKQKPELMQMAIEELLKTERNPQKNNLPTLQHMKEEIIQDLINHKPM
jgi:uncharacterized membrane-anchored protein YhcB (DUF1043 family)